MEMQHSMCFQSLTTQGSTVPCQICLTECDVEKAGPVCGRRKEAIQRRGLGTNNV